MSRKAGLAKKIAHTLMAMSIVYSSGINIVVNEVYAAEKNENITSSSTSFSEIGVDGNNFSVSGGVTSGEDAIITGKIAENITNPISITAQGGKGGLDNGTSPTVMQGATGGAAVAKVTVDESKSSVTAGNISVTATGGKNGSAYQGMSGVAGAAAAYGLQIKHDLTITAADIQVKAEAGYEFNGIGQKVDINAAKHSGATAIGLQADGGIVSFEGTKIIVQASTYDSGSSSIGTVQQGQMKLSDGGDAEACGIRVTGGTAEAKLSGNIAITNAHAAAGTGFSGSNVLDIGKGGNAYAYGVDGAAGIATLDIQDIVIEREANATNYISGGDGGNGTSNAAGGKGGSTVAAGVHVAGGTVNGKTGNIVLNIQYTKAKGGSIVPIQNSMKGRGGDGGDVYAAGLSADGGETDLTVASMDISAKSSDLNFDSSGGSLGNLNITDANAIKATGQVQAAAGKGSSMLAVGVDNRGGNSKVKVTGGIKVETRAGQGGSAFHLSGTPGWMTDERSKILAEEVASGEGGTATSAGLRNASGSLTAEVAGNLEIKAIGGAGGPGMSTYGTVNGIGGVNGAAAAYGINVLGGQAVLTVADITVEATGGTSTYTTEANSGALVNNSGAGVKGSRGGNGGIGNAYGVSNSGGSLEAKAAKITAKATGGQGNVGSGVAKQTSAVAAGIGGDGGDGGNAYAYGVFGTGSSSRTVIAVDEISASATAGAGGAGAAANIDPSGSNMDGVATAGSDGAKGEEAKAYGVYAASGAVIDLSAKTGSSIKINAKAADGSVSNETYAVYADKGTVLFGSDAELNWDGSVGTNNALVTGLNNATLGFSGISADRNVTGGTLQLTGSNAFRFTTDLANNKADSMTFETIENNSSKQYIQIGYEEAFKDALSEADIVTIKGSATVLTINDLNGQNLKNFTGQASSLDSPLDRFRVTPTVEIANNEVKITEIALAKEDTPSETGMVASDAQMALASMWRIEGNNVMKRMGELRSDKEAAKGGVWARYYRGELSADSAYDRSFNQDYTAFQGGIDKVQDYKGGKLYTGIAVNRIDSNAGYTAGSGDLSSTGIGIYASWLGSKGHYLDVIARGSKLTNDFKLVDSSNNTAKADYDTWAYGISTEYGYRQNLKAGWFVEPQAELSLGHIGSVDYTISNEVSVKQDSVNSAVVRLGFLGGKEFTIGGRTSNAYLKASALHDFGGNGGATGYYGNGSRALQTGDLTGTWYEIGLGANLGIAKNSNLYFDALKTFNGNLRTDWQFNAGLRFTF